MALLGVLLVVAVLLAGGGAYMLTHTHRAPVSASAKPTATPVATAIPMRTITDTSANVRFNIPMDWSTTGSVGVGNGFVAESTDHNSAIVVAAFTIPSGATFDKAGGAKGAIAGAANYGSVTYEQGPTNVSLAGETWAQVTGSFSRDGVQYREVALVTTHGGKMVLLSLLAQVDSFDAANARDFQPLVQSFAFLS
jgi:hypothetical protein